MSRRALEASDRRFVQVHDSDYVSVYDYVQVQVQVHVPVRQGPEEGLKRPGRTGGGVRWLTTSARTSSKGMTGLKAGLRTSCSRY